jgi:hypothetical protein
MKGRLRIKQLTSVPFRLAGAGVTVYYVVRAHSFSYQGRRNVAATELMKEGLRLQAVSLSGRYFRDAAWHNDMTVEGLLAR